MVYVRRTIDTSTPSSACDILQTQVHFAQEIVEQICDYLDQDRDLQFLLSCAPLSRSWCYASRRISFRSVYCQRRYPYDVLKFEGLCDVLASPLQTIGRHIRKFTMLDELLESQGTGTKGLVQKDQWLAYRSRTPFHIMELHGVLQMMPLLRELCLSRLDFVLGDPPRVQPSLLPGLDKFTLSLCYFVSSDNVSSMVAFAVLLSFFPEVRTLVLVTPPHPPLRTSDRGHASEPKEPAFTLFSSIPYLQLAIARRTDSVMRLPQNY